MCKAGDHARRLRQGQTGLQAAFRGLPALPTHVGCRNVAGSRHERRRCREPECRSSRRPASNDTFLPRIYPPRQARWTSAATTLGTLIGVAGNSCGLVFARLCASAWAGDRSGVVGRPGAEPMIPSRSYMRRHGCGPGRPCFSQFRSHWPTPRRIGAKYQCRSPGGAFFSALLVNALPPLERSRPTPAVVWQAASKDAEPINASNVRTIENLCIFISVQIPRVSFGQRLPPLTIRNGFPAAKFRSNLDLTQHWHASREPRRGQMQASQSPTAIGQTGRGPDFPSRG